MILSAERKLGVVCIGRNEGERLQRCLASVGDIPNRVYVDSGSSDGSVASARARGVTVVELLVPPPFTAARARNAGLSRLLRECPYVQFVQMLDGDCELRAGWIETALAALERDPGLAVVFGRLRERHPERSIYNALCDDEWNVPVGEASGCGGNALFRVAALQQVNFYNPAMIAGEDSEMSIRLRKKGWRLQRLDAEMSWHDAAIVRFGQWWSRTRRSGHAFAEMAHLHPDARVPDWPRSVRSILVWGGVLPALLLGTLLLGALLDRRWLIPALMAILAWALKIGQLAKAQRRRGLAPGTAAASGLLLMLGKLPQMQGVLGYYCDRLFGQASHLIEYK